MLDLLYLSRTVVPAHLSELEQLDVLDRDEQMLVAFDGVLMDGNGSRLSGPTLHDYCLLTGNRVLLWARDYAEHICYAYPLSELREVFGQGMDPLHAQLQLTFCAEGDAPQRVILTLLPLVDLPMALMLLTTAAEAARELEAAGVAPVDLGGEVQAVLSAKIYGDVEAPVEPNPRLRSLGAPPYRWQVATSASPGPTTSSVEAAPEVVYTIGRLGRSAWDTLTRSVRESDLPFELNGASLRDITSLMQAANDLLGTISSNPEARETVLEMFGSMGDNPKSRPEAHAEADDDDASTGSYREIPLRRRGAAAPAEVSRVQAPRMPVPAQVDSGEDMTGLRGIPLRRRRASGE